MPDALDRLFDTPELHFLAFDEDDALFIHMDRASYHRSIFLDHRIASYDVEPIRTAASPLIADARERAIARTGWIFHIAHCGSTLLSRMIDSPNPPWSCASHLLFVSWEFSQQAAVLQTSGPIR